jgi:hypothetical protein
VSRRPSGPGPWVGARVASTRIALSSAPSPLQCTSLDYDRATEAERPVFRLSVQIWVGKVILLDKWRCLFRLFHRCRLEPIVPAPPNLFPAGQIDVP